MNRLDGVDKEGQEHEVGLGRFAGSQQVDTGVGGHAPVVVLTADVDTGEGFLMEEHTQLVAAGNAVHDVHQQNVVVDGYADFFEDGSALELCGGHFIMTGAQGNAQFIRLVFVIAHEGINSFRDAAEVVVFQLLAFGRSMTEYCPSAHHEVRTGVEQAFVYYEILLFPAEGCRYFAYVLIKIMANVNSSFIQGRQRLQQGSFVVQGFSRIRNKNSWDTKGFAGSDLHNESRRRRVPGCVTAGFESRAQATTWKGRGIRFLLDQGGAVKFFDGGTITLYRKEGIMLFSGGASQRLEPMGEVSNTFCLSPLT